MAENSIHFGIDIPEPEPNSKELPSLDKGLASMNTQECDFICLPLLSESKFEPFGSSSRILSTAAWCSMVVGKTSSFINCDSSDLAFAKRSMEALKKEIAYATHCTLPSVMVSLPRGPAPNLARIITSSLIQSMFLHVWILVPLCMDNEEDESADVSWQLWNDLRALCHNHSRLGVILDVTENLPKKAILDRWVAEPVKGLMLDTSVFTVSQDGCHLPLPHYQFLLKMHHHKVQCILRGKVHPRLLGQDLRYYKNYIINTRSHIRLTQQETYEAPYQDYLQAPLQPLMDNLESQTYEVFEKDPVKYAKYEEAVAAALVDLKKAGHKQPVVLMVVGAGRGPLVKAAIRAEKSTGVPLKIYAVEKNPNAVVTLNSLLRQLDWKEKVTIVETDMRVWEAPEKCDIMVSELLGSFGDNELSPECLDGAERFLRPGGIMIPKSYRSYLAPLQSHKLHTDVLAYGDLTHVETAYVVKIHAGHLISPAQEAFEFVHPKPPPPYPQTNERVVKLSFQVENNALCHGFAGYFDATLYGDITISIHPVSFSPGMFSWFPIYFPIKTPVHLKAGNTLTCVFWRVLGTTKVWYEWCLTGPTSTPIHNPTGRSYWVGL